MVRSVTLGCVTFCSVTFGFTVTTVRTCGRTTVSSIMLRMTGRVLVRVRVMGCTSSCCCTTGCSITLGCSCTQQTQASEER